MVCKSLYFERQYALRLRSPLKLINFTSFQILLIVSKLSPLTNVNALHTALVNIRFNIAVACQYNTNSPDIELPFVFYREPKSTIFSKIYYNC